MNEIDWADYLQRFSTKALWHFTGYNKADEVAFQHLLSIVKNRLLKISEKPHAVRMPVGNDRYGYRASCMCDIPFRDLQIHIARYRAFGLAFRKESAIKKGHFNPVLYLQNDHVFFHNAAKILPAIDKLAEPHEELKSIINEYFALLGTYIKVGDLTRMVTVDPKIDEEQRNNFYYEREWRSAYDWRFDVEDVLVIMMPKPYIEKFKDSIEKSDYGKAFLNLPIIPAELVSLI